MRKRKEHGVEVVSLFRKIKMGEIVNDIPLFPPHDTNALERLKIVQEWITLFSLVDSDENS